MHSVCVFSLKVNLSKLRLKFGVLYFLVQFFLAPTIFQKGFGDHSSFRQETLLNTLTSEVLPCKYILNPPTLQNTLKCIIIQSCCKTSRRYIPSVSKIPTNEWCIHQLLWKNEQMVSVQIQITNLYSITYNTLEYVTLARVLYLVCISLSRFVFTHAKTKGRNHYTPWSARQ